MLHFRHCVDTQRILPTVCVLFRRWIWEKMKRKKDCGLAVTQDPGFKHYV